MAQWAVRQAVVIGILVVGACAFAEAPAQFQVVERYAALLSEGDQAGLRSLFAPKAVFAEYDLLWGVEVNPAIGAAVSGRVRAMVAAGVRVEIELLAVEGGGALLVTRERMWGDTVPEVLAPLRATGVYLVVGEQIVSITRVLDADQREEMVRDAIIGTWRSLTHGGGALALRLDADGTYLIANGLALLDELPWDSGRFDLEGGVLTFVSGADTYACRPGDVGSWWVRFDTADWFALAQIEEACKRRTWAPGLGPSFERVVD
jgi:limonene-1,2-epoxide hydrolase